MVIHPESWSLITLLFCALLVTLPLSRTKWWEPREKKKHALGAMVPLIEEEGPALTTNSVLRAFRAVAATARRLFSHLEPGLEGLCWNSPVTLMLTSGFQAALTPVQGIQTVNMVNPQSIGDTFEFWFSSTIYLLLSTSSRVVKQLPQAFCPGVIDIFNGRTRIKTRSWIFAEPFPQHLLGLRSGDIFQVTEVEWIHHPEGL